jgi:hypothetical protein
MPGGLLNIVSYGNQNIILNGNPSKTFFKTVYSKYSNFGIQKFQVDYNGLRSLQLNEDSVFTFKIPRNAELLLDTYLCFDLPNIWSPIIPPDMEIPPITDNSGNIIYDCWKPYEFRWIDDIGTNIIKNVTLTIGGQIIQTYSGEYIKNMVDRDFTQEKKELFNQMTGMTNELTQPEIAYTRYNQYPNAYFTTNTSGVNLGPEPSIRGRRIYVPLHFWFSYSTKIALPLVCLQYSEVVIDITLRPIRELFTINDVSKTLQDGFIREKIAPDFGIEKHSLYRFLQPPPDIYLTVNSYINKINTWANNIHLIATYCFLSEEEARVFAKHEHKYLIKDIKQDLFTNTTDSSRLKIYTSGLVSSWMWYFKRSDAYLRNEWSNYSNWKYKNILPYDVIKAPERGDIQYGQFNIGPGFNIVGKVNPGTREQIPDIAIEDSTFYFVTQPLNDANKKQIMNRFSIFMDGKFRENEFDQGIYSYIEKYKVSDGNSYDCLYNYNFALHSNPYDLQPSGAINLSKFKTIEFEINTITPPLDPNATSISVCDINGNAIGTINPSSIYKYNYDFYLIEERYNMVRFISGQAGLVYAR